MTADDLSPFLRVLTPQTALGFAMGLLLILVALFRGWLVTGPHNRETARQRDEYRDGFFEALGLAGGALEVAGRARRPRRRSHEPDG